MRYPDFSCIIEAIIFEQQFERMIILLSPAKSLDFETPAKTTLETQPEFLNDSERLVKKLKKLSSQKIGSLMGISPALSDLNYERYQNWKLPFTTENAKPCSLAFTGAVYQGWGAKELNDEALLFAQNHVRILSGLYGILKPLDLIQPYRLEMGTRFEVTPKVKNLYVFWKKKLTEHLNETIEKGNGEVVNLASNEYFKAIDAKTINGNIITPVFKDLKNGEYKTIMTFAKLARGYMTRYAIDHRITAAEELKGFNMEGYSYSENMSSETEWVFVR